MTDEEQAREVVRGLAGGFMQGDEVYQPFYGKGIIRAVLHNGVYVDFGDDAAIADGTFVRAFFKTERARIEVLHRCAK